MPQMAPINLLILFLSFFKIFYCIKMYYILILLRLK